MKLWMAWAALFLLALALLAMPGSTRTLDAGQRGPRGSASGVRVSGSLPLPSLSYVTSAP